MFGTDVPQRIFHYLCADTQQQRQRKRVRQQQMQEQRLWVRQKEAQQGSLPPPGLQPPRRDRPSSAPLSELDSAALSPLQLQSRLEALGGVLGREVAFVMLSNQPELLDLDPETAQQRLAALSQLMGLEGLNQGQQLSAEEEEDRGPGGGHVHSGLPLDRLLLPSPESGLWGASLGLAALEAGSEGLGSEPLPGDFGALEPRGSEAAAAASESGGAAAALWWMLERRGDVLLMAPEQLQANLEALTEGLG